MNVSRPIHLFALAALWSGGAAAGDPPARSPMLQLDARPLNLSLVTSFQPVAGTSDLQLVIAVSPPVTVKPIVDFVESGSKQVRAAAVNYDQQSQRYIATLAGLSPVIEATAKIQLTGADGKIEEHFVTFVVQPVNSVRTSMLHAREGQFSFFVSPGKMNPKTHVMIAEAGAPLALPVGVIGGPFQILPLDPADNVPLEALVAIRSREKLDGSSPQIRHWIPQTNEWESLVTQVDVTQGTAFAPASRFGVYVLVSSASK